MPLRWILIALIAAIIIGSQVLSKINLKKRGGKVLVAIFVIVSCIDLWPRALPLTPPAYQPYVQFLKTQPYGAVIDDGALTGPLQLYDQTLDGKPRAFGYVTRTPKSVDDKDYLLWVAINQGRVDTLCKEYKIRYYTTPLTRPLITSLPVIYQDNTTLVYDLKNSSEC